jgi:hypothetical protein
MTRQNIWEIVTVNDLVKILKEHENKFVIIGLTLQDTPIDMSKIIKKFLKDYSKIYKNITFLYLNVLDKDLGRINIIKKDKSEYPFVYHIYNTSDIFVSVNRVNKQTLYESMYAVEKYYKKDLENYLSSLPTKNTNNNVIINNNLPFNNQQNNIQQNNIQQNNIQQNNTQQNDDNNNEEYDENQEQQQINDLQNEEAQQKVLEHENLLNRIVIFEEKKKIHNLKFLEDIQKRKKEEKNNR